MIRPGLALLVLTLGGCEREREPSPPTAAAAPTPASAPVSDPVVAIEPITESQALSEFALATVDAARLRTHVSWLADDERRGRATPSASLDEAADYLRGQLQALGLVAPEGAPGYMQRFECGGPGHPGEANNVLAVLPGRDPALREQTVMVSAHYDHLGERGFGADRIYNGANDNASGTAAMLAVAGALAASPPRRSVLFAAFCGEERGLRGSYHYAAHPVLPLDGVVAHVNLEMLGRPGPASPPVVWIPGMARSELGEWLNAAVPPEGVRFVDGWEIGPEEGAAFDRSDNYPLAQRGVVAHTVASGPLDALYHSLDDEAESLDYERMAHVVRAIARGVHRLAEQPGRPRWSDPPR